MPTTRFVLRIVSTLFSLVAIGAVLGQVEHVEAHHITEISGGGGHACALADDGSVQCWGRGDAGQLGNGSRVTSEAPVNVIGLEHERVVHISAGLTHTCALTEAGDVYCWGGRYDDAPTAVEGLGDGVVKIAGGFNHDCALYETGRVRCWGDNSYGQLGDGTTTSSASPVDVVEELGGRPIDNAIDITSQFRHTCILTDTSGVQCWGHNAYGNVGNGTSYPENPVQSTPVDVAGMTSGVIAVAVGEEHSCALLISGDVACWGFNSNGQLGNGTAGESIWMTTPAPVIGLDGRAADISAGGLTSCAIMESGSAKCWGWNFFGQAGDGKSGGVFKDYDRPLPVDVVFLENNAAQISQGGFYSCALTTSSGVVCWGSLSYSHPGDSDGDGCTDLAEQGAEPAAGGQRDPATFWDFMDVPTSASMTRDRSIGGADISEVVRRFGSVGNPETDPLSLPPAAPAYHTAYDRGPVIAGYPWNVAPPDGVIAATDVYAVIAQFGHSCA